MTAPVTTATAVTVPTSNEAPRLVTIFGGSGFVGRHLVRSFAKQGWRVRVAVRRPDLAFHLQPLGTVGQIQAVQANLRYPNSVASAMIGADLVINLVGLLTESGRQSFESVQVFGARAVARAAAAAGVPALIHMSTIGADINSPSVAAASRARGEAAVLEAFPNAIITRASVIFGPEDTFFNRFATLARILPVLPLIGGGETKFQPVFVGDIADAMVKLATGAGKPGTIYEFGGPEVASFKTLMHFVLAQTERKRLLAPLPFGLARGVALVTELANTVSLGLLPPEFLTTRDQVTLLESDNIVSAQAEAEGRTLRGLGITPSSYEAIAPAYLQRYRKAGEFDRTRIA
eukprot:gene9460-9540_t